MIEKAATLPQVQLREIVTMPPADLLADGPPRPFSIQRRDARVLRPKARDAALRGAAVMAGAMGVVGARARVAGQPWRRWHDPDKGRLGGVWSTVAVDRGTEGCLAGAAWSKVDDERGGMGELA
jgi:hypothetical protein